MFRDPGLLPRAARAGGAACCAPIRRSRSGSPAAAPARRRTRSRSCCARRGCSTRTLIYATDINPHALQKAEAGVYDADRIAGFTENHRRSGAAVVAVRLLHGGATGGRCFDKSLRKNIVFSDHSLATDSVFAEVQLVSCRNVLIYFDRDAAGSGARAVQRVAVPQGVPRHRRQGVAALLDATRGAFVEVVRGRSHLTRRPRTRREVAGVHAQPDRRGRRSAHRPAGSRRSRCCCRRCPPTPRRPVLVVIHLPRERPSLLAELFQPKCAVTVREAQDKDPLEAGTVYFAPPDYHLLVDEGPQLALSADEPVIFHARPLTSCSSRPPTSTANDCSGSSSPAPAKTARRGSRRCTGPADRPIVQDPATAQSPFMAEAAIRRSPVDFVMSLDEIARVLGHRSVLCRGELCVIRVKCLLVDDRGREPRRAVGAAPPGRRGSARGALRSRGARACSSSTTWRSR